mmetsp:Transcript_90325/g.132166  ORF Transcript_90325/g.132166 Transcript_90325/m.132166 type:complete len:118 (-) Transcript_90325:89-442(-)
MLAREGHPCPRLVHLLLAALNPGHLLLATLKFDPDTYTYTHTHTHTTTTTANTTRSLPRTRGPTSKGWQHNRFLQIHCNTLHHTATQQPRALRHSPALTPSLSPPHTHTSHATHMNR